MSKLEHIDLINEMIDKDYISVRKHTKFDLWIYNYTRLAEGERVWNEATELCRGIICDKDLNVVARPFTKFFNYEEIEDKSKIPNLPFEVYEKLDGSLGILYFYNDVPYISTRGSFDSDQAKHATEILHSKYANKLHLLDRNKTYLFEIIYNDNSTPLVVDYGDEDDIFLIGVINTDSGDEDDISIWSNIFRTTSKYDNVSDYMKFRNESNGKNREGFVIKFSNGFRMKLKFSEYFELHSLMKHLSTKKILTAIIENKFDDLKNEINHMSEECQIYFSKMFDDLMCKYKEIEHSCEVAYYDQFSSKADLANYFNSCDYSGVLFAMYNHRDYYKIIWKYVKNSIS